MRKYLQKLDVDTLRKLRNAVASAVGNDWRSITDAEFISRFMDYCKDYNIRLADVLSAYQFLPPLAS